MDETESTAEIQAGVPEGSPLIPALFHIFIDKLADSLERIPRSVAGLPVNLFADDVALMAAKIEGVQFLLDKCTAWANKYNMHWAPDKCKVLCGHVPDLPLKLAGREIEHISQEQQRPIYK